MKTGRCVVVHEATRTSGFGAELAALVQERCFYHLEAPVARVTGFDTPYPHSLAWAYFPGPVRIGKALKRILERSEEHTSELQSLMRISYAVFCLKIKKENMTS